MLTFVPAYELNVALQDDLSRSKMIRSQEILPWLLLFVFAMTLASRWAETGLDITDTVLFEGDIFHICLVCLGDKGSEQRNRLFKAV